LALAEVGVEDEEGDDGTQEKRQRYNG